MGIIVPYINTLFLGLAVLLNINKWIYFSMRIMAKVRITNYEDTIKIIQEREEEESKGFTNSKTGSENPIEAQIQEKTPPDSDRINNQRPQNHSMQERRCKKYKPIGVVTQSQE